MPSHTRKRKHTPHGLSKKTTPTLPSNEYMSPDSKRIKTPLFIEPITSSPENLGSISTTSPESLRKKRLENVETYINETFDFLRDTSIIKTGRERNERKAKIASIVKETNVKLLSKYPELKNNAKFMAMIKGANTRTFGGKLKKTYKNNNKYRKRRTVKRKFN
jgi:predicted transcriptional regulator